MEIKLGFWVGFIVFIVVMLFLDLFVFHKKDTKVKVKEALLWSFFWILLALIFNIGVYHYLGDVKALEFFTAYVLEKSLSVDNLFVFIMIFSFFKIKAEFQHKILFWGIFGALIMRSVFIFMGVALISQFAWIMYIFGVFLIYTGIQMFFQKENSDDFNPDKNILVKGLKKIMPISNDMSTPTFFVKKDNVLHATPFFISLIIIEASDVIFAVDSIPAVLAVSTDTFIVFTSNIFAILGLRSLYFALNGVMEYFKYLKYGLSVILTFIGLKMCINEFSIDFGYNIHISNIFSLLVIISLLMISIFLSVVIKPKK